MQEEQVEFATLIFTILSGVSAGLWATATWRRRLRWNQAKLARKMLDEIFDYAPSNDALRMVDDETDFKDRKGTTVFINMQKVRSALASPWGNKTGETDDYIRWCFDALFYYFERLEQSLEIKIIRFEDIRSSLEYYLRRMATDKMLYVHYAVKIGFNVSLMFMDRFDGWRETNKEANPG